MKNRKVCMITNRPNLNLSFACLNFVFRGCRVEFWKLGQSRNMESFGEIGRARRTTREFA